MKFTTRTGSIYHIDRTSMRWMRTSTTEKSGSIRAESGKLLEWPSITLGEGTILHDDAVRPGAEAHYVLTSPVTSIEEN